MAPCPHCKTGLEFRVRGRQLELGYTYWSGSMHFEGMLTCAVPGLRMTFSGESPVFVLKGQVLPSHASDTREP
ncbi:MAG: hypothetical protein WCP34_03805 [Pseudomonadota bacterium]